VFSHTSYLINLASPDAELRARSLDALTGEVLRCETLGLVGAVLHPGAHMGGGEDAGLRRVARGLGELHRRLPGFRARVLLENTAGQGTGLGSDFAHLGRLLAETHQGDRLGVCLDTCHALAAGYDLGTREGYERTFRALEREVGLDRLLAFHLNDSRRGLGSRVDRHAHIGEGELGLEPFGWLVNDARFQGIPAASELPPDEPGGTRSGEMWRC
jgi:deoxyribonuclease-4